MNTNLTPTEILKNNADQIANMLRDYGLPMIAQLEINACVDNIIDAAKVVGSLPPGVRIMRDPSVGVKLNTCKCGDETARKFCLNKNDCVRIVAQAEKEAVASIVASRTMLVQDLSKVDIATLQNFAL